MSPIEQLQQWIQNSKHLVFFGGAGVSTESGIPDFRSVDGLYHKTYQYPPEVILSHSFYKSHTDEFFEFYKHKMLYLEAKPNAAHEKLAQLEKVGKCKAVITQNIDGLHTEAGSKYVLELHGAVSRNFCQRCNAKYDAEFMLQQKGIPTCHCGGTIKPDVVLYEESLNEKILKQSIAQLSNADVVIVAGTSLTVYPAAGLLDYYEGNQLVYINKEITANNKNANLVIAGKIGEILSQVEIFKH